MNDYDGLNLCAECGDAYTTGTLCPNCARQRAIDNDPMTGYDAIHYDPVYGYDDDGDDYLDMYDDDDGEPSEYIDGYWYGEDDTIELAPTLKWEWFKFKLRLKYIWQWKLSHPVHRLRMKYDKRYRDNYWTDVIPF